MMSYIKILLLSLYRIGCLYMVYELYNRDMQLLQKTIAILAYVGMFLITFKQSLRPFK